MGNLENNFCIGCHFFLPDKPKEWTPKYPSQMYDGHAAAVAIRDGEIDEVSGRCVRFPKWLEVGGFHYCGEFKVDFYWNNKKSIREIYDNLINGSYTQDLQSQVSTLKKKLSASQRLSASRLKRLQEKSNG